MFNAEWSLVFFTLFSQFSLGLLLSSMVYRFFLSGTQPGLRTKLMSSSLFLSFLLMAVALVISFLHLASPLSSVYALSNLAHSWLSREIMMASLYAFLLFMLLLSHRFLTHNKTNLLMIAAGIAGIYLIYSMARLYMLPTVPPWNSLATLWAFYISAFVAGPSLFLALYHDSNQPQIVEQTNKAVKRIFSGIVFISIAAKVLLTFLANENAIENINIAFITEQPLQAALISHWLLVSVATIALILNLSIKKGHNTAKLYYLAFFSLVLAEIIYRIIFYASYFRIGL